jgi:hypothetical protein
MPEYKRKANKEETRATQKLEREESRMRIYNFQRENGKNTKTSDREEQRNALKEVSPQLQEGPHRKVVNTTALSSWGQEASVSDCALVCQCQPISAMIGGHTLVQELPRALFVVQ